ncbi:hypothetical protein [Gimesia maris]|uniref:hypothetical protein n=1 Tax=Gimesia maris TaxID=122 RepID=UPI0032F08D7D|tara:strand:+ start:1130 stop:1660 length:531 start_codon:yes stop_codon:yes gene_type:complete
MFQLSDPNMILTGVLLLTVAWMLRKNFRYQHQVRNRSPLDEAQQELSSLEQSQFNRLNQLEIKLYEYGREVESRSDDRLRVLDELLREADQEINRLRQQLALTQQKQNDSTQKAGPDILVYEKSQPLSATAEKRLMMVYLSQAGFSAQEISNCFQCPREEVERVLAEDCPPGSEIA